MKAETRAQIRKLRSWIRIYTKARDEKVKQFNRLIRMTEYQIKQLKAQ